MGGAIGGRNIGAQMMDKDNHLSEEGNAAANARAPIDPGIAVFLNALRARPPQADDIVSMRKAAVAARLQARESYLMNAEKQAQQASEQVLTVHADGSDLQALSFSPLEEAHGLIVYFHGGGWSLLNAETHAPIMQHLAEAACATVVGPNIPLAPEVGFPDLLNVCITCVEALREAPQTAAKCQEGLILAGDSSGANLALATALSLRDAGRPIPDALILAYGVVDCDLSRASYALFADPPYPLSAERMERFWSFYCRDESDRSNVLASPLRADLAGLPPTRIVIAEQDVLRDENLALVDKMGCAGVPVACERIEAATHAFWEACLHSNVSAGSIASAGRWARTIFQESADQTTGSDQ